MHKLSRRNAVLLVLAAFLGILVLGTLFFALQVKIAVSQAQQEMVVRVAKAHLLGAGTMRAIAFFRQQKIVFSKSYTCLEGDGWERFSSGKIAPATLGMVIDGQSAVLGHRTGFLTTKGYFIEVSVLFDGKGKAIGVEVRPIYVGFDS